MFRNLVFKALLLVVCAGISVRAAEIILQPVSASEGHTIEDTVIRLDAGGQRVRLEVKIRGFAPHLLKTFQARLDSSGYSNTSPIRLRPAFVSCPSEDNAGDQFCWNAFGETGLGAPTCDDWISDHITNLQCEPGWINQSRTDWLMFGHLSIALVDLSTLYYRWGGTLFELGNDVIDEGLTYYAGTLMVDVPADAVGSYTIGWDPEQSWLLTSEAPGQNIITPQVWTAATIRIRCSKDAQCDDQSDCTEEFCDLQTQECNSTVHPDGTACVGDWDACTTGNGCSQGKCGAPLVCTQSPCNFWRICDPQIGCPALIPVDNGTVCDDGNSCTSGDHCLEGDCMSGKPRPDGFHCDDRNLCTFSDECKSGTCVGVLRTCRNGNACNNPGVCIPETGECTMAPKPDGTVCEDGDPCTAGHCEQGACQPVEIPDCLRWQDMFDCLQGPGNPKELDCDPFDLNGDGFVDLLDVKMLLESY